MKRIFSSDLVRIITVVLLGSLSISILQPIMPLYLTSIGIIPTVLGLMVSVAMVGMVLGEGSGGWITDKLGLKFPMGIAALVCALVVFSFTLTQKLPLIFLLFFLWGIARSMIFPVGRGYIGAAAPLMKKATFMAIYASIMAAVRSLAAFVGGFIVDWRGFPSVFFISSGVALLSGIMAVTGLRGIRPLKDELPAVPALTDQIPPVGPIYRSRPVIILCTAAILQHLEMGISGTFLPLLATQVAGATATEVGIIFTVSGLVTMVLLFPMGWLADRYGKRDLMILGIIISASGMVGLAFAQNFSWIIVFVSIRSLGMAMFSPAAVALLSGNVPRQQQSTVMGIYGACEDIGIIAGSTLGGFLWSIWGQQLTFITGAITSGLGVLLCLSLTRDQVAQKAGY
ncbi:MAG: MFS transporter [Chloroflexi bacterium]|nr:MFS transporter [Chloroflexota bacterium]